MKVKISEIFSSIQGEGLYLGKRHIFVRFYGCNMRCAYCDTIHLQGDSPRTETVPFEELSIDEVINEIKLTQAKACDYQEILRPEVSGLRMTERDVTLTLSETKGKSLIYKSTVSLTGGEPLIHAEYLKLLLKELKALKLKTYLETNGTLPDALKKVIDMIDIIAMDIKLPSSTHDRSFWDEHEEFLKIAKRREVFIKIVVTGDTKKDEFEQAVRIIQGVAPTIPLVIQPVTPCGSVQKASHTKLNNFYNYASSMLENVRIIPQVHKIMEYR